MLHVAKPRPTIAPHTSERSDLLGGIAIVAITLAAIFIILSTLIDRSPGLAARADLGVLPIAELQR